MKLDLHRLRHAITVAETRSFSRAAELLAITQPALSRSIATLEDDLGLRLFDRDRSGVFITQAGANLLAGAKPLLTQAHMLEQTMRQLHHAQTGVIHFGMSPMVASLYLSDLFLALNKTRHDLILRPLVRKTEGLLTALSQGEIESFFMAYPHPPQRENIVANALGPVPIGLFARAGHPLASSHTRPCDSLDSFPLAASVPELPNPTGGLPLATSIVCDNYALMKELILASDTISLMSPLLLRDELRRGEVVRLNMPLLDQAAVELFSIRLSARTISKTTKLIQDVLLENRER